MKNIIFLLILGIFSSCRNNKSVSDANQATTKFSVSGNCGMCQNRIEAAAKAAGASVAVWNVDSKIMSVSFNSAKTNDDNIQKAIAATGHDTNAQRAPDAVYNKLPGCCQYERLAQVTAPAKAPAPMTEAAVVKTQPVTVVAPVTPEPTKIVAPIGNPLTEVYTAYFSLKDALVRSEGKAAAAAAKTLYTAIENVKTETMKPTEHTAWTAYQKKLSYDAEHIKGVIKLDHQREHFVTLSQNMFEVMQLFKPQVTVYFDHCPMANDGKGANWLSLEKGIKNPYYGASMLTCGKVEKTIE